MKRKTGFFDIFVLLFCFFFVVSVAYAFTGQIIIENSKKYLGYSYKDWQSGQCKMFVRQMVSESGGYLGPGYRFCYLDVGKEVLPADVEPGDIIQLDSEKNHNELIDRNGNSGRNYTNGMHTAIILEKVDGSKFKVIESNIKPLTVGIREWNPWETANKYNLHVHFYRLWDESVAEKPVILPDILPNIPEPFNQPVINEIAKLTSNGSYTLALDVSQFGWTRIQVPPGKYLIIASGEYNWDPTASDRKATPNGESWTASQVMSPEEFPLPDAPIISLLCATNNGIFFIGENAEVDIPDGVMSFGFNERWFDYCYEDNSGAVVIVLTKIN